MLNLKGRRVAKGLTQEKMARLLNMETSAYARKEKGQVQFRLDEIKRILLILDCKFEDIFLG